MGFLKKLVKGVKNIFKGVTKAVSKFAKSDLGKLIIIGAAIYTGGVMMNAWQGPQWMSGIQGAFVGGPAAANGAVTNAAPLVGEKAAVGAGASALPASAPSVGATVGLNAPGPAASSGFGSKLMGGLKATGGFIKENPMATYLLANTASSMASPDEEDIINAKVNAELRLEDERKRRMSEFWRDRQGGFLGQPQGLLTQPINRRS